MLGLDTPKRGISTHRVLLRWVAFKRRIPLRKPYIGPYIGQALQRDHDDNVHKDMLSLVAVLQAAVSHLAAYESSAAPQAQLHGRKSKQGSDEKV